MKKNGQLGFTLAEVLITLSIIGVVAAMTLPTLIQNKQDKELIVRTKKLYSDLGNALILAQKDLDVIGDNSALFNTTDSSYEVAKNISKYLNAVKVCSGRSDSGCSQYYYDVRYATLRLDDNNKGDTLSIGTPTIILSNGAIVRVSNQQRPECAKVLTSAATDGYGRPIKNPDGSDKTITWTSYACGYFNVDVNGNRTPNQYGRDVYEFPVYKEKLVFQTGAHVGGKSLKNIFSGYDKLEYENYKKGASYNK